MTASSAYFNPQTIQIQQLSDQSQNQTESSTQVNQYIISNLVNQTTTQSSADSSQTFQSSSNANGQSLSLSSSQILLNNSDTDESDTSNLQTSNIISKSSNIISGIGFSGYQTQSENDDNSQIQVTSTEQSNSGSALQTNITMLQQQQGQAQYESIINQQQINSTNENQQNQTCQVCIDASNNTLQIQNGLSSVGDNNNLLFGSANSNIDLNICMNMSLMNNSDITIYDQIQQTNLKPQVINPQINQNETNQDPNSQSETNIIESNSSADNQSIIQGQGFGLNKEQENDDSQVNNQTEEIQIMPNDMANEANIINSINANDSIMINPQSQDQQINDTYNIQSQQYQILNNTENLSPDDFQSSKDNNSQIQQQPISISQNQNNCNIENINPIEQINIDNDTNLLNQSNINNENTPSNNYTEYEQNMNDSQPIQYILQNLTLVNNANQSLDQNDSQDIQNDILNQNTTDLISNISHTDPIIVNKPEQNYSSSNFTNDEVFNATQQIQDLLDQILSNQQNQQSFNATNSQQSNQSQEIIILPDLNQDNSSQPLIENNMTDLSSSLNNSNLNQYTNTSIDNLSYINPIQQINSTQILQIQDQNQTINQESLPINIINQTEIIINQIGLENQPEIQNNTYYPIEIQNINQTDNDQNINNGIINDQISINDINLNQTQIEIEQYNNVSELNDTMPIDTINNQQLSQDLPLNLNQSEIFIPIINNTISNSNITDNLVNENNSTLNQIEFQPQELQIPMINNTSNQNNTQLEQQDLVNITNDSDLIINIPTFNESLSQNQIYNESDKLNSEVLSNYSEIINDFNISNVNLNSSIIESDFSDQDQFTNESTSQIIPPQILNNSIDDANNNLNIQDNTNSNEQQNLTQEIQTNIDNASQILNNNTLEEQTTPGFINITNGSDLTFNLPNLNESYSEQQNYDQNNAEQFQNINGNSDDLNNLNVSNINNNSSIQDDQLNQNQSYIIYPQINNDSLYNQNITNNQIILDNNTYIQPENQTLQLPYTQINNVSNDINITQQNQEQELTNLSNGTDQTQNIPLFNISQPQFEIDNQTDQYNEPIDSNNSINSSDIIISQLNNNLDNTTYNQSFDDITQQNDSSSLVIIDGQIINNTDIIIGLNISNDNITNNENQDQQISEYIQNQNDSQNTNDTDYTQNELQEISIEPNNIFNSSDYIQIGNLFFPNQTNSQFVIPNNNLNDFDFSDSLNSSECDDQNITLISNDSILNNTNIDQINQNQSIDIMNNTDINQQIFYNNSIFNNSDQDQIMIINLPNCSFDTNNITDQLELNNSLNSDQNQSSINIIPLNQSHQQVIIEPENLINDTICSNIKIAESNMTQLNITQQNVPLNQAQPQNTQINTNVQIIATEPPPSRECHIRDHGQAFVPGTGPRYHQRPQWIMKVVQPRKTCEEKMREEHDRKYGSNGCGPVIPRFLKRFVQSSSANIEECQE